MKQKEIKCACAQMDIIPGKVEENFSKIINFLEQASSQSVDIIVFPECVLCDYYVDNFQPFAKPIPGEHSDRICELARRYSLAVVIGLIESAPQGLYNTAILIDSDGKILAKYRKTHLSVSTRDDTIARETDVFLAGDVLPVFDTAFARVGIMICKDGMIAEVPRTLAVKGAEIIFWPTNCGWIDSLEARYYAHSNRLILVAANRANGFAKGGGSIILDWRGGIVTQAENKEELIVGKIDTTDMAQDRKYHWQYDRKPRPELYTALTQIRKGSNNL